MAQQAGRRAPQGAKPGLRTNGALRGETALAVSGRLPPRPAGVRSASRTTTAPLNHPRAHSSVMVLVDSLRRQRLHERRYEGCLRIIKIALPLSDSAMNLHQSLGHAARTKSEALAAWLAAVKMAPLSALRHLIQLSR